MLPARLTKVDRLLLAGMMNMYVVLVKILLYKKIQK